MTDRGSGRARDRRLPPLLVATAALVLGAALASCARQALPPGGPPDNIPPVVVSTSPDTFAVVEPFDGSVVFRFSERISEQPTRGTLQDAVLVAPETGTVEVSHNRSSLEVSVEGGFRGGLVYRVRLRPVVQDMFDNPMVRPFELVFSTGAAFRAGTIAGEIRDRITGDRLGELRVHAVPDAPEDRAVYGTVTDDDGIYVLRYLAPGTYDLTAFEDRNRNREPDGSEPRASERVRLAGEADTAFVDLEVLEPDTTPARITAVEAVDSVSLRIETDDPLDPRESLDDVSVRLSAADAPAPSVDTLLHEYEWEARRRELEEREPRPDTAPGADTVPQAERPDTAPGEPEPEAAREPPADREAGRRPDEPPRSEREIYALLAEPLEPGVTYTVVVEGVRNIAGVAGGGGEGEVVYELPADPGIPRR